MFFHQPHNSVSGNSYNAVFYENKVWNFHFHKNPEIIYVLKGKVNCTINSIKEELCPGEFAMCLSNEIHSIVPEGDASYWVCVFSEDCVHTFAKAVKGKIGNGFKFCCNPSVKAFFEENLMRCESPSLFMLKSCLYALCDEYLKKVELVEKSNLSNQLTAKVYDYVCSNFKNDIKLSDIAKLLGYEYHYVSRWFKTTFNMSFNDYVNLYRLDEALYLITETEMKLLDVALESGFQSVRTFNDCFKEHYGKTPREYKKHINTNKQKIGGESQ